MKPEPPTSVRLDNPTMDAYRALSARVDLPIGTLLRWAAKHYLDEITSGRVVILPFADGSHAEQIETEPTSAEATAPVPPNPAILTPGAKSARRAKKA